MNDDKDKAPQKEMPVTDHPGATKNDGDPQEEKQTPENTQVTLQSQKGKKVDADPTSKEDQPTRE